MSLFITSLNSGSNGNCYYIGNEREAVLIDAGISCHETERRMARLNLNMRKVKAIFISHEHSDHINGVTVLAKKYNLPVYITPLTHNYSRLNIEQAIAFNAYEPIKIGGLSVIAFPKFHDAADPHSFIISYKDIKVGVFTDIGMQCEHVTNHFAQCHAAFLEANYDDELLEQGRYPYHLKSRIRGGRGHLSNKQALDIFIRYKPAFMNYILLSHLSKDNNRPEIVQQLFDEHADNITVVVASRFEETAVYHITSNPVPYQKPLTFYEGSPIQYTLF